MSNNDSAGAPGVPELDPKSIRAQDAACLRRVAEKNAAVAKAEAELRDAVKACRDREMSWTAIAGALGITRQAVSQRFG